MPNKNSISNSFGEGGDGLNGLRPVIAELQAYNQVVVAGVAAGTAMPVPTIRDVDNIASAVVYITAGGAPTDGKAGITAQSLKAGGSITLAAVANADTVTVNSTVYTFKTVPTSATDIRLAGTNAENAAKLVNTINAYENRRIKGSPTPPVVVATLSGSVVTVTAIAEGTAGNALTLLSSNGVRLAVTGAGTLTGGSATGSIKSTDNLTGKTVVLSFYSKAGLVA